MGAHLYTHEGEREGAREGGREGEEGEGGGREREFYNNIAVLIHECSTLVMIAYKSLQTCMYKYMYSAYEAYSVPA